MIVQARAQSCQQAFEQLITSSMLEMQQEVIKPDLCNCLFACATKRVRLILQEDLSSLVLLITAAV